MKRRTFLGLAASAVAWPRFLRVAFADSSVKTAGALANALERGRTTGKPVLAIVIPADDTEKRERGQAWGELLNFGTPEQLWPLGLVEVVCATPAELGVEGEPLAVLVEPGSRRARPGPSSLPRTLDGRRLGWDSKEPLADRRIPFFAEVIRTLIAPDGPTPAQRAATAELAATAVARVRAQPPPGSHWALASGCGGDVVEDLPDPDAHPVKCGMGHCPAKSRRFLYFYSRPPGERARILDSGGGG